MALLFVEEGQRHKTDGQRILKRRKNKQQQNSCTATVGKHYNDGNSDVICRSHTKRRPIKNGDLSDKSSSGSSYSFSGLKIKSAKVKTKHLLGGIVILAVAVVSTALIVYFLTSSSSKLPSSSGDGKIRFEPPDPEEPLPPSHSVLHSFKTGAVCSDGPPCSKIGRDILDMGGSAVDATLAALFCNGIVNSQSMGLGGGFIMTIYNRTALEAYSLVSREVAPLNATKEMFMKDQQKSRTGILATGVPGELRGYWAAWIRFGRLPWAEIIKPSIKICRDGYHMGKHQYDSLHFRPKEVILADPNLREWFVHPDTNEFKPPGSLIRPTKLCDTLQIIADNGGDDLYNGTLARLFVEDIQEMGGIITLDDMKRQQPKWRNPINASLHGQQTVYTAPPPGSGALLAFILNIIDGYKMDHRSIADINSTILTTHRIVEAYKYAFALRTELADPDFIDISSLMKNVTSKEYAEEVRKSIRDDRTFNDSDHYGAIYYNQDDHGTAHISVLAQNGDAVSVTSTINLYFGAGLTSKRTGIILNSGMDDFSVPGIVNYFGVHPSPNNFIEPGKMSLSSVSPTIIVDKAGNVTMVIGASGGTKITTAAAGVITSYTWFNRTLKEAVDQSRIHHQLYPMEINYEYGVIDAVVKGLKKLGHKMRRYRDRGSIVCALARHNNTVYANADYRKGGEVYGVD